MKILRLETFAHVFLLHFCELIFGKSENVDIAEPSRISGGRHESRAHHVVVETSKAYPKEKAYRYSDVSHDDSRHRNSISAVDFGDLQNLQFFYKNTKTGIVKSGIKGC